MTPAQAMAYSRKGKRRKGVPIESHEDGIELSRRANLRLMQEARALIQG